MNIDLASSILLVYQKHTLPEEGPRGKVANLDTPGRVKYRTELSIEVIKWKIRDWRLKYLVEI